MKSKPNSATQNGTLSASSKQSKRAKIPMNPTQFLSLSRRTRRTKPPSLSCNN